MSRYRWAFTGDPGAPSSDVGGRHYRDPGFVPHVIKIARLFNNKVSHRHIHS